MTFLLGAWFGYIVGVFVVALCQAAAERSGAKNGGGGA